MFINLLLFLTIIAVNLWQKKVLPIEVSKYETNKIYGMAWLRQVRSGQVKLSMLIQTIVIKHLYFYENFTHFTLKIVL